MDFSQCELEMTGLQKFRADNEKYCNALSQVYNSFITVEYINEYIDTRINEIAQAVGDESDWIAWYFYETDFGKKNTTITINKKEYDVSKLKDFYNLCLAKVYESETTKKQ